MWLTSVKDRFFSPVVSGAIDISLIYHKLFRIFASRLTIRLRAKKKSMITFALTRQLSLYYRRAIPLRKQEFVIVVERTYYN